MRHLGLEGFDAYRLLLARDPSEWRTLDSFCRITISRFYRDRAAVQWVTDHFLPRRAEENGPAGTVDVWSAGCASGEEPYTLALAWALGGGRDQAGGRLSVLATDADPHLLSRALDGVYEDGCLRDVPDAVREAGFEGIGGRYRLRNEFRSGVRFALQDIRAAMPEGRFDLVLCRNLAFTYFDRSLQERLLRDLLNHLKPGGGLVIGGHEALPGGPWPLRREAALSVFVEEGRIGGSRPARLGLEA